MTRSTNPSVPDPAHLLRVAAIAAVLSLTACGGGEEEQQAEAPPPPPPVQAVEVESVADVMKRLGTDRRVRMDESERPNTGNPEADLRALEATLTFFDGMVRGSADRVQPLLGDEDRKTLALMRQDGQWEAATAAIDRVTVGCAAGQEPETVMALGIYMNGDRFEAQLWTAHWGAEVVRFEAVPQPPGIIDQLKGNKAEPRVQQWMKILKEQVERSKQPDEKVETPQQDRSLEGEGGDGAGSEDGPSSPGAPGGQPSAPRGPGKRKPGGPTVPGPSGPGGPSGPAGPGGSQSA
jgi:hypothetical protein